MVNRQGRVTLPAAVRRKLEIREGSQLEVSTGDREIRLRPVVTVPLEDAWLYTPKNLAAIRRGMEDIKAGRVYRLGSEDLERLIKEPSYLKEIRKKNRWASSRRGR